MGTVEKFLLGGLFVVGMFIMVNPSNNADGVIDSISGGLAGIFKTLQAR